MTSHVADAWRRGHGEALKSLNPATGDVVWEGNAATADDVAAAVKAAREAFTIWSMTSLEERTEIIRRYAELVNVHKQELATLISEEAGKVMWDALGEATAIANKVDISLKAYDERTGSREAVNGAIRSRLSHRPHGVMAVFGPYNFPGHLPNGHIVPSLIAGNTVVFKPSELTPAVAEKMVRIWEEAGLPPGVLNLVQGGRDTGAALAASPDIDGLLFTGSAHTGLAIARQLLDRPNVIQALEMGGNNPLIVHEAEDKQAAAVLTILSAFVSTGQRCTCARRLIVPNGEDGDAFVAALATLMGTIQVGPGDAEPEPFMGPLVSAQAADNVLKAQAMLEQAGGKVIKRAERLPLGDAFLSPGLIDVTDVADRPDEEVFGPLLQVIRVDGFDAAIAEANNTKYGLASGLISDSRAHYDYFFPRSRAGIVNWNQQLTGAASTAPFGGIGWSGNHRPSAYYAADYCAYAVATMEQAEGKVAIAAMPKGLTSEKGE